MLEKEKIYILTGVPLQSAIDAFPWISVFVTQDSDAHCPRAEE